MSQTAVQLGLVVPVPFIDDYTEDLDEAGENGGHGSYYEHALDLSEKLFDGEIDQPTFEEHLRYMVGIKAYPLFTIDKLIATMIKHVSFTFLGTGFVLLTRFDRFIRLMVIHEVKNYSPCLKRIE